MPTRPHRISCAKVTRSGESTRRHAPELTRQETVAQDEDLRRLYRFAKGTEEAQLHRMRTVGPLIDNARVRAVLEAIYPQGTVGGHKTKSDSQR